MKEQPVIKVFIASPGGLEDERNRVEQTVEEVSQAVSVSWGISCEVLRWERGVGDAGRPQEQINPLVRVCDVFIGLLGDRWGSPTGTQDSGFEEEWGIAYERRSKSAEEIPKIMLFTKTTINAFAADQEQLRRVLGFVAYVKSEHEAWINPFATEADLVGKCQTGLWKLVLELIGQTPPSADTLTDPSGQEVKLSKAPSSEGRSPRAEAMEELEPALRETSDQPEDWKGALTDGSLRRIGELQRAQEAEDEAEEQPLPAAQAFAEIAAKLEAAGDFALADIYAQRAAHLFKDAGDTESAAELIEEVGRRQATRGSELAEPTARSLLDLLGADEEWRGEALLAMAVWPEDPEGSIEALRAALERLDAAGADSDDPDRLEYTAALVELLALRGEHADVLAAAAKARETPLCPGPRLRIELDAVEAVEAIEGPEAGEGAWERPLAMAEELGDDAEAAAVVWQRRGIVLAAREQVGSAREAFRRAALEWQRQPENGDQVREAYFGAQIAAGLNAVFAPETEALRPFAAHLRGGADTPAARADSLEESGMGQRIHGKPLDALRNYMRAYVEHRRAGNLRGMCFVLELLGELQMHAEFPHEATRAYVLAGREAKAAEAAGAKPDDGVLDSLDLGPARWRRAASFAAIAAVGRTLTSAGVARVAKCVVDEAMREFESIVSPQPVMRAQEALAAIAFELPDELRGAGLRRLRELASGAFLGTARPANEALLLLTNAGLSDETTTLVETFLADDSISGVSAVWIGERLADDPAAKQAVLAAAKEGNRSALEAAAVAELVPEDPELLSLCERQVEQAATERGIKIDEENGREVQTVSVGAGYEILSIEARFVSSELRSRFATALAALVGDERLPIPNRASAANGLYNLAASLDVSEGENLAEVLRPMIDGEIEISPWDEPASVFSRFQINFGREEDLRAALLSAWARLKSDSASWSDEDLDMLEVACVDTRPVVAAAGYEALARLAETPLPPFAIAGLSHGDGRVRAAATRAWLIRMKLPLPEPMLTRLLEDDWLTVRLALVWNTDKLKPSQREELLGRLTDDRDAYVRALAHRALKVSGTLNLVR